MFSSGSASTANPLSEYMIALPVGRGKNTEPDNSEKMRQSDCEKAKTQDKPTMMKITSENEMIYGTKNHCSVTYGDNNAQNTKETK